VGAGDQATSGLLGAEAGREPSSRLATVGFVLRSRNLRRLHVGRLLWQAAELAQVVALLVFAYERGGAAAVATFGVVRTAAAAGTAPLVAVLGDRYPRAEVLAGAAATGAAALALGALAVTAEAPALAVYAASALAAVAVAAQRPTAAALVPSLVQRPAELVAHNLVATVVEGLTALAGPVLGAVLVDQIGVEGALAVTSAMVASASVALGTLRQVTDVAAVRRQRGPAAPRRVRSELVAGFRELASNRTSRLLALLGGAQTTVRGALNVLVVVLAVDLLGMRESGVGLLLGAIGVGSLLGGVATVRFVSSSHLGRTLAVGIALWGAPIAVVSLAPGPGSAAVVLAVIGLGNVLVDVSLFTLLQRSVPNHVLARAMGALESWLQATMALGAALAAGLLAVLSPEGALAATGLLLPAAALASYRALVGLDRQRALRDGDVELLRDVPLLRPLSLVNVEELAARLSGGRSWAAGGEVVRAGGVGDAYYIIEAGRAQVLVDGDPVAVLERGDGFGEVALLRDVPRIATVRATEELRLRMLDRDDFLAVVTGDPRCEAAADEVVVTRLAQRPEVTAQRPTDAETGDR
jgi:MFS family permease